MGNLIEVSRKRPRRKSEFVQQVRVARWSVAGS